MQDAYETPHDSPRACGYKTLDWDILAKHFTPEFIKELAAHRAGGNTDSADSRHRPSPLKFKTSRFINKRRLRGPSVSKTSTRGLDGASKTTSGKTVRFCTSVSSCPPGQTGLPTRLAGYKDSSAYRLRHQQRPKIPPVPKNKRRRRRTSNSTPKGKNVHTPTDKNPPAQVKGSIAGSSKCCPITIGNINAGSLHVTGSTSGGDC